MNTFLAWINRNIQESTNNNLFHSFAVWYDHKRGNWDEVIAAARKSKSLASFLRTIRDAYIKDNNQNPSIQFNGMSIRGMTRFAEIIEANVRKHFPHHSFRDPNNKNYEELSPELDRDIRKGYMSGKYPPTNYVPDHRKSNPSVQPNSKLLPFLQSMEKRLRDVEEKLGMQYGSNASTMNKNMIDTTADYRYQNK